MYKQEDITQIFLEEIEPVRKVWGKESDYWCEGGEKNKIGECYIKIKKGRKNEETGNSNPRLHPHPAVYLFDDLSCSDGHLNSFAALGTSVPSTRKKEGGKEAKDSSYVISQNDAKYNDEVDIFNWTKTEIKMKERYFDKQELHFEYEMQFGENKSDTIKMLDSTLYFVLPLHFSLDREKTMSEFLSNTKKTEEFNPFIHTSTQKKAYFKEWISLFDIMNKNVYKARGEYIDFKFRSISDAVARNFKIILSLIN